MTTKIEPLCKACDVEIIIKENEVLRDIVQFLAPHAAASLEEPRWYGTRAQLNFLLRQVQSRSRV